MAKVILETLIRDRQSDDIGKRPHQSQANIIYDIERQKKDYWLADPDKRLGNEGFFFRCSVRLSQWAILRE